MNLSKTSHPACPFFIAGQKITDPRCFVGRKEELRILTDSMSGVQPISVNVVGERLSGKSSLLQRFLCTYAERVTEPSRFLVVFLCLRLVKPKTEAEFYQSLADALSKLRTVQQCQPLRSILSRPCRSSRAFGAVLDVTASIRLLPVFCLDEFEKLFDHKDALTKDFYDGLHSLTNSNKMMLIIATRRPVEIVAAEQQLLSPFFNFGQLCKLKEFSEQDAEALVNLPDRDNPALTLAERQLALKWGSRSPWQLQLAAWFLFEAQRNGKKPAWAKQQFERERRRRQLPQQQRFLSIPSWCRAVFCDFPRWLGSWPLRLGRVFDDTANYITGWILILVVLACVFGYAGIADLFTVVRQKVGL